jgi:hypothetical protein
MRVGHHTHLWNGKELPGVNVWMKHAALAFSEKRFTLYLFGIQLINWIAR